MTTTTTTAALRSTRGTVRGTVNGLDVHAVVYAKPSTYGIGGAEADLAGTPLPASARISKLWVVSSTNGHRSEVFNYDRSLEIDRLSPCLVEQIVAAVLTAATPA